jgi:hypothetical protein
VADKPRYRKVTIENCSLRALPPSLTIRQGVRLPAASPRSVAVPGPALHCRPEPEVLRQPDRVRDGVAEKITLADYGRD